SGSSNGGGPTLAAGSGTPGQRSTGTALERGGASVAGNKNALQRKELQPPDPQASPGWHALPGGLLEGQRTASHDDFDRRRTLSEEARFPASCFRYIRVRRVLQPERVVFGLEAALNRHERRGRHIPARGGVPVRRR